MHWKIKRDKFYSKLYEQFGQAFIENAGWFEDTSKEDYKINVEDSMIMCTPLNFVYQKILNSKKPCILLTTGSFSPIHSGHIDGMVKTREHLEKLGWDVVGGYFAPDHDEYIMTKLGPEAIPFVHRMEMILKAVREYDWLTVDPWAGICQSVAVNFTDIIKRMEEYVFFNTGVRVPIIYVCGGDNARFAKTFLNEGYCAIVQRPGYDFQISDDYGSQQRLASLLNDRIFVISNDNGNSSTKIRNINKWRRISKKAIIRCSEKLTEFEKKILNEIESHFESIRIVNYEYQDRHMQELKENVVTLDPYTKSIPSKLEVSRIYDYMGIKMLEYGTRPGSSTYPEQILSWNIGNNIILHDDDIFSGGTMKYATKLVEQFGYNVIGTMSYVRSSDDEEIIDLRDFILDEFLGGLVIRELDQNKRRYPYIYPYVCPFIRASIENAKEFSIKIWELNKEYFEEKEDWRNVITCDFNLKILKQ